SIAAAMMGMSKRRPQRSHEMSTSLGFIVRAPGTSAMSSKPYAALALRPRPTHMPIRRIPLGPLLAEALYVENRLGRPTVFRGKVYEDPLRVSTLGYATAPGFARSQINRTPSSRRSGLTC